MAYKSSASNVIEGIFIEIMKEKPNIEDYTLNGDDFSGLNTYRKELNAYIIRNEKEGTFSERSYKIFSKIDVIKKSLDKYILLKEIEQDESLNNTNKNSSITVPIYGSDNYQTQIKQWEKSWITRMTKLQDVIKRIPDYSYEDENFQKDNSDVRKLSTLENDGITSIITEINELLWENSPSINSMDRAKYLFLGKHRFLAIISLILALLLDTASLLAGLFVYYITYKNDEEIIINKYY